MLSIIFLIFFILQIIHLKDFDSSFLISYKLEQIDKQNYEMKYTELIISEPNELNLKINLVNKQFVFSEVLKIDY